MFKFSFFALPIVLISSALFAKPKPYVVPEYFNLIGHNPPLCLAQFSKENPNLKAEIQQLREGVVYIDCGPQQKGSAVYVDVPSARILVTSEHIVSGYEAIGYGAEYKMRNTYALDPSACVVLDPVTHKKVKVDRAFPAKLGHPIKETFRDASTDWMVLALEHPLKGKPLKIAERTDAQNDSSLLAAGATGRTSTKAKMCFNLVNCTDRHVSFLNNGRPTFHYTDCSGDSGDSGGAMMVRNTHGELVVAAIETGSDIDLAQGSPYDQVHMVTKGIGLSGHVLDAIRELDLSVLAAGDIHL